MGLYNRSQAIWISEGSLYSSSYTSAPTCALTCVHTHTYIPDNEFLVHTLVEDQVQVALSEACLLVLESKVQMREHMQAGREEGEFRGHNA